MGFQFEPLLLLTLGSDLRLAFRTDASLDIGTGHVMRCLTLADALRERGASCYFVCRAHPGNLLDLIRQRGYEADALPLSEDQTISDHAQSEPLPAHSSWVGTDWATDAQQTLAALGDVPADWLIVDHYGLDARWEHRLRPDCRRLMVIDDLADRSHHCDLLLDQNLGRRTTDYHDLVPAGCTVLAGPKYALLRPEFPALRPDSLARRASPQLKNLLITMGGIDKNNATLKVLDALRDCALPEDSRITVVMGVHAPWLEQVRALAATLPWPTEVRINISDMAQVMADSDLAIGAAGSTSWERCCLGLPTLLVVQAENQWAGARALQTQGAALLIGEPSVIQQKLAATLTPLLTERHLAEMSFAARAVTDGQGACRVVQHMERQP